MIKNQWYAILESKEVPPGKPVGITRFGEKLALWRDQSGGVRCVSDLCPHRGAALSAGKLVDGEICCPFHGFEFDSQGQCICIPANGRASTPPKAMRVRVYPVQETHQFIFMWYGENVENLPPVPWLDDLEMPDFSFSTLTDTWETHYSRAIENQLDVVHLPFVHHNTIGRGNRCLVNGPKCQWIDDPHGSHLLNVWVLNEKDYGQSPKRAGELTIPNSTPSFQFRFPNLWQLMLSKDLRIFVAFVPVDERHTRFYLRQYQRVVHLPVLKEIFNLTARIGNRYILNQDRSVVLSQRPLRTELQINETLIPGDGPIIEYRRRREALLKAAEVA